MFPRRCSPALTKLSNDGVMSPIGTFRTWPVWQTMSAFGSIAEVPFQGPEVSCSNGSHP
jgi:hypothetical protein